MMYIPWEFSAGNQVVGKMAIKLMHSRLGLPYHQRVKRVYFEAVAVPRWRKYVLSYSLHKHNLANMLSYEYSKRFGIILYTRGSAIICSVKHMLVLKIIIWQLYADKILGCSVHSIERALNFKNGNQNSWPKCLRQLTFCLQIQYIKIGLRADNFQYRSLHITCTLKYAQHLSAGLEVYRFLYFN
jgi:hypothetical protein